MKKSSQSLRDQGFDSVAVMREQEKILIVAIPS